MPRVSPVQARPERPAASADVDAARPRRSARLRTTEPSLERLRSAQRKGNSAATIALVVMSLCFAAVTWWVLRGPAEVAPSPVGEPARAPTLDQARVVAPRSPLLVPPPSNADARPPAERPSRAVDAPGSPARAKVAAPPPPGAPTAPNTKPEVYE